MNENHNQNYAESIVEITKRHRKETAEFYSNMALDFSNTFGTKRDEGLADLDYVKRVVCLNPKLGLKLLDDWVKKAKTHFQQHVSELSDFGKNS